MLVLIDDIFFSIQHCPDCCANYVGYGYIVYGLKQWPGMHLLHTLCKVIGLEHCNGGGGLGDLNLKFPPKYELFYELCP